MLLIASSASVDLDDDSLLVRPEELQRALGWSLSAEGLCMADVCLPLVPRENFVDSDGRVDLEAIAMRTMRPLVVDREAGVVAMGEPAGAASVARSVAPGDVVLERVGGGELDLGELRGHKVVVATWASWCLCRHDLVGWEEEFRSLRDDGLELVTVALDEAAADALPWLEAAGASHHACVDPRHRIAEVFGMVNVPMVVWIDESGRVVRPADTQFATADGAAVSGMDWRAARRALRRWVVQGDSGVAADSTAPAPTRGEQLARTHWNVAQVLLEQGDRPGALRHLDSAGRAAPHDFTIRRAGLKIQGEDPFGELYWEMREAVLEQGGQIYHPLPEPKAGA